MKTIKSILLLSILFFSISCSDDNSEENSESVLLFDMLYSGTYITDLRDTESSNPPTDEDYVMELYPSKGITTTGKLKVREHTIPFTARKHEISKYPNDKFFQITIKDYNGKGNNATMTFHITSSTRFRYDNYNYENNYIRDIVSPLIGEYFYLID